jgi:hypothetical protein
VNERGEKASFSLIYGSKGLERHLTVMQQEYRRAGVDMRLRLLEPGTAFERGLERKYEMTVTGRTAGFYPSPASTCTPISSDDEQQQHLGLRHAGGGRADRHLRGRPRLRGAAAAMHRIDEIVHDEAFYIPFWSAPYIRVAYWDYVRFPEFYLPRRTEQLTDYMVYWIDPEAAQALDEDMRSGRAPIRSIRDRQGLLRHSRAGMSAAPLGRRGERQRRRRCSTSTTCRSASTPRRASCAPWTACRSRSPAGRRSAGRRVGLRQERHRLVDPAAGAEPAGADPGRNDPLRGRDILRMLPATSCRNPRAGDRDDLPGPDDLAQPGVHGREAAGEVLSCASAGSPGGARAIDRDAATVGIADPEARSASIRTSCRAG